MHLRLRTYIKPKLGGRRQRVRPGGTSKGDTRLLPALIAEHSRLDLWRLPTLFDIVRLASMHVPQFPSGTASLCSSANDAAPT